MPSATCSGPIVISLEDAGQMSGSTFFVVSDDICLNSSPDDLTVQVTKSNTSYSTYQYASAFNCNYFNRSTFF